MADHSLKGKTALITGGAKNLGALIARDLAANGSEPSPFIITARNLLVTRRSLSAN